jgi:hypothetical protein
MMYMVYCAELPLGIGRRLNDILDKRGASGSMRTVCTALAELSGVPAPRSTSQQRSHRKPAEPKYIIARQRRLNKARPLGDTAHVAVGRSSAKNAILHGAEKKAREAAAAANSI